MVPNAGISSTFNRGLLLMLGLNLVLDHADQVAAQGFGVSDLPTCAAPCASTAATAAGCNLTDTSCLCSHPAFSSATAQCADSSCGIEDLSAVSGILGQLCASQTPSSSLSPTSSGSDSTSSATSRTSSNTATTTSSSPTTQASTPSSVSVSVQTTTVAGAATPAGVATGVIPANGLMTSGSSTLVVVQTVVLPQTSSPSLSNAACTVGLETMGVTLTLLTMGWAVGAALF